MQCHTTSAQTAAQELPNNEEARHDWHSHLLHEEEAAITIFKQKCLPLSSSTLKGQHSLR